MANVHLKNNVGVPKTLKVGFSWTTFFFGGWVAMFRGQWGEVAKWFFLNPITLGIWGIVQCWTANKKTVIYHLEKGYEPATETDRTLLKQKSIIA
ncbi:hypothetical protein SAMN04487897_10976 [Paenibacillus sp. yr247]|uniref:hypothetical protein n=1 Tax=Paenibacillus sp. yr247 TaxID=1761880 RepID=UPI00087E0210|nr:hypothetical protein [Paenibacillus sp. yr247]SDO16731.1 hypothetical protein SAMN04487897_10976 [Paenibacillus sp. yr247]